MPRTNINYNNTIIYKLVHKEDYDNANIYIGSTTDFIRRKCEHKKRCKNEKDKNYNNKTYQFIRNNGGWECFNMIEVEKYPCNDGNEVRQREEYWRCYLNANLNMIKAFRTKEQEIEDKKYYRDNNKETRAEYDKKLYEKNKDLRKEHQKEKITCECGCVINRASKSLHIKSKKHAELMAVQELVQSVQA